ncbi:microprocessor complex subunit DGCR8 [Spodoptera frugiperda]|uniref:Microprocessor complex subunit DGCR8 n=1 Tax=Spodoptera frugiperda TaxID=7108 RepID=A0A9R0DU03_SPOFR|nr:microprocessor complex subunit DGCR8 [Spodoptera frugiperda]
MSEETQLEVPAAKKLRLNDGEASSSQACTSYMFKENQENGEEKFGSEDSYGNFVTPEELERLREFKVLDEVKSNDEDSNDEESDSSDGLPEEEIEKMLEEDLPEDFKGAPKQKEKAYITRQTTVLEEKGVNHFEVLPLDWIMVRHISGMPIYMHRATRVCTLSKPYFLGSGNTRRHDIPISAIPCFAYRRALEEEEKQKEIDKRIAEQIRTGNWVINSQSTKIDYCENSQDSSTGTATTGDAIELQCDIVMKEDTKLEDFTTDITADAVNGQEIASGNNELENQPGTSKNETQLVSVITNKENGECPRDLQRRQPVVLPGGIVMPPPRVETVSTSWKTQHLSAEQINEYCRRLFKFKTVNIMHFKRWADRRKYTKARKTLQYPTLPEGTKLITIPAQPANTGEENAGGGKTTKRDWVMNMNGRSYLSVFHEYVRRALQKQPVYEFKQLGKYFILICCYLKNSIHILIPEMKDELDEHAPNNAPNDANEPDFTFFDYVGIEDPRITEFCAATCEPSPHAILRTCLLRNFGAGDRHIHTEMKKLEYQKIELTMKVGKHTATVISKNKKMAKQRASQSILQALHPHVRSWGSLLRLYGSRSVKSCKEKKLEEQQITLLQDKARHNEPNYAVLDKLRNEMRKLRERDEAVVPIGTLLVHEDLPTHSGSNLNNVDL